MADPISAAILAFQSFAIKTATAATLAITGSGAAAIVASNFVAGMVTLGAAGGGLAATLGTAAGFSAISSALSPKPQVNATATQLQTKVGATTPRAIIMGRAPIAGTVLTPTPLKSGKDDRFASNFYALSHAGPSGVVESVIWGDDTVTFDANGNAIGKYNDNMWLFQKNGDWNQTAISYSGHAVLGSSTPSAWDSTKRARGCLTVALVVRYAAKVLGGNMQTPIFVVDANAAVLIDPRTGSPATTQAQRRNPAVWAYSWRLGWFQNSKRVIGMGQASGELHAAGYAYAANVADANGWTISGEATTADDRYAVETAILQACASTPVERNGLQSVVTSALRSSVGTITSNDLRADPKWRYNTQQSSRPTAIQTRYRSESNRWQMVEGAEVTDASWLTQDAGREKRVMVEYAYAGGGSAHVGHLAALEASNAREPLVFNLPCKQQARYAGFVGDAVTVSLPEIGLSSTKMTVQGRIVNSDGTVDYELLLETDSKYAFAAGKTSTAPSFTLQPGFDIFSVPQPGAAEWTSVAAQITSGGTTSLPIVRVTGSAADYSFASGVVFKIRLNSGGSPWLVSEDAPPAATQHEFRGLTNATSYIVGVAYRGVTGIEGPVRELAAVTTGVMVSASTGAVEPGAVRVGTDIFPGTGSTPLPGTQLLNSEIGIDGNGRLTNTGTGSAIVGNAQITIDANGRLTTTGTGSAIVDNGRITIDAFGRLTTTGTGSAIVDNGRITIDALGRLTTTGTGSVVVDNSKITLGTLGFTGATDATRNVVSTGLLSARPTGVDGDIFFATDDNNGAGLLYTKIAGAWVADPKAKVLFDNLTTTVNANEATNSSFRSSQATNNSAQAASLTTLEARSYVKGNQVRGSRPHLDSANPNNLFARFGYVSQGLWSVSYSPYVDGPYFSQGLTSASGYTWNAMVANAFPVVAGTTISAQAMLGKFGTYNTGTIRLVVYWYSDTAGATVVAQAGNKSWESGVPVAGHNSSARWVDLPNLTVPSGIQSCRIGIWTDNVTGDGVYTEAGAWMLKAEYGPTCTAWTDEAMPLEIDARVRTEESARASADSALATRSTTLEAQMANTSASGLQSRIATEETTRATADSALATRATTLEAQMGNTSASGLQSRISTEESARASADSALASRNTTLEAIVRFPIPEAINKNPTFSTWSVASGVYPEDWGGWGSGGSTLTKATGTISPFAYREANTAGTVNNGIQQELNGKMALGWHVLEAEVTLNSGSLVGAGVHYNWGVSGITNSVDLIFTSDVDITGAVVGIGVVGRRYRFSKLVNITVVPNISSVYAMTNWEAFATSGNAKDLTWHKCLVRPATQGEIDAKVAKDVTIPATIARIATEESTRASADTALATRATTLEAKVIADQQADFLTNGAFLRGTTGWNPSVGITVGTQAPEGVSGRNGVSLQVFSGGGTQYYETLFTVPTWKTLDLAWTGITTLWGGGTNTGASIRVYLQGKTGAGGWVTMAFTAAFTDTDQLTTPKTLRATASPGYDTVRLLFEITPPSSGNTLAFVLTQKVTNWTGEFPSLDMGPRALIGTEARIATEETTRATADTALATRATTLEAQMANTSGSGLQSRIATEESTRASADSTQASQITTLTARSYVKGNLIKGSRPNYDASNPNNLFSRFGWLFQGLWNVNYSPYVDGPYLSQSLTSQTNYNWVGLATNAMPVATGVSVSVQAMLGKFGTWVTGTLQIQIYWYTDTAGTTGITAGPAKSWESGVVVAGQNSTARWVDITAAAPAGVQSFRLGINTINATGNGSYTEGGAWMLKAEYGSTCTAWTDDALPVEIDARVTSVNSVAVDGRGRAYAISGTQTEVNGRKGGFVMDNDGVVTNFQITADDFRIYQSVGSGFIVPFRVVGGQTQIDDALIRNLNVIPDGGGPSHRVQLRPNSVSGADGASFTFSTAYGGIPLVRAVITSPPALAAGETYEVVPVSLSTSGFTVRAKKFTPGTPTAQSSGAGSNVGGTPAWQVHKPTSADGDGGQYTFTYTARLARISNEFTGSNWYAEYEGSYDVYYNAGAGWVFAYTDTYFSAGFYSSSPSTVDVSASTTASLPAIGQHGGAEFGIHPSLGAITAFAGVSYTTTSQSSVVALPGNFTFDIYPPT